MQTTQIICAAGLLLLLARMLHSPSYAASCDQESVDIATTPIIEQSPARLTGAKKMAMMNGNLDVLIIGDSIARQWAETQARDFDGMSVMNMGLGGERIQELRWRLEHLPPKAMPERIVLIIGTNNLSSKAISGCAIAAGISAVAGDIKAMWPDARLFIVPILPRGPRFEFRAEDRMAINRAIAETVDGAAAVQIDENAFTCRWSDEACHTYQPDNLHLTTQGYTHLRAELRRHGL